MELGSKVRIIGNMDGTDKYPYHSFEIDSVGVVVRIHSENIIVSQNGITQMIYNEDFEMIEG